MSKNQNLPDFSAQAFSLHELLGSLRF